MSLAPEHNPQTSPAVAWLQLLHLADSALPIGAMAHSFGVETLVAEAGLTEAGLPIFFAEWLAGTGCLEAFFCLAASAIRETGKWTALNAQLSAFKPARESREASLRLGKRYLSLAASLIDHPEFGFKGDAHLAPAFGLTGHALGLDAKTVAAAYLHQTLFGAISACQRLLPLGQSAAMKLLWTLKPAIARVVETAAEAKLDDLWTTQPMLEIASMRHPQLPTRLFIS
jgi:urease accessory protein